KGEYGYVFTVLRRLSASLGVKARSACCTRFPSCPKTDAGISLAACVQKNTPIPFDRIKRIICSTCVRKAFDAPLNNKCASSKKNTNFGLSRSPTSGSFLNNCAKRLNRKVENTNG